MQGRKWIAGVVAAMLALVVGFVMAVHTPDADGRAGRQDSTTPVTTITVVTSATTPPAPPAPVGCGTVTTSHGVTTSAAPGEIAGGFRISAGWVVTCVVVAGCWVQVVPPPGPDGVPPLPEEHWVPVDAVGIQCGTAR